MDMGGMSAQATVTEAVGVVDSVDQAKGMVTLSHEPIASLNWPAMTMDFAVKDKALFNKLIVAKKVQFKFVKQGNRYVVTGVK
jgi:Cu(I)/Ag(I) efflux system periplasmic protein CusF